MADYFCNKCGQPMPRNMLLCYECNTSLHALSREELGTWDEYYGIDQEAWDDGDYDEVEDEDEI